MRVKAVVVHWSATVNVVVKFAARLSGGSLVSVSETPVARTVRVQASPSTSADAGSAVNVVGPPVTASATEPLIEQERVIAPAARVTGSLKVTVGLTSAAAEPSLAGSVSVTDGAGSTGTPGWAPRWVTVSMAKPSHSIGRVEGVCPVGVAGLDGGLAAKGVVHGARGARPPRRARVEPDLPEHVDDGATGAALAQHDGVVAVPVGDGGADQVRHGQDRRVCAGVCRDEHLARGQGARQRDRLADRRRPVAVQLQPVPAGGEVDGRAGAVVDLDRPC